MPADIVLVTNDLGSGGTERVLTTLANAWSGKGRKVTVITLSDLQTDFYSLETSIRRIAIGMAQRSKTRLSGFFNSTKRLFFLRCIFKEAGASVVISFLPVPNILTILATFGLNASTVICERNDPSLQVLKFPWNSLRRLFYRYADTVTANSHGAVNTLKKYVPEKKLFFVPNPLTVSPSNDAIKKTGPLILTVGSLTPQKAHDILLYAFARIVKIKPEWRLAIVGDGHLKNKLKTMARQLGIADHVDWHGQVGDPFPYYRAADIFVLPSRFEGMPNVLLEAMSCGLPVIVSDASPGPLEYVVHETSGLVVPANNVEALSAAIQRLITDKELRSRLGRKAIACLADCEISKVLKKWENVLSLDNKS